MASVNWNYTTYLTFLSLLLATSLVWRYFWRAELTGVRPESSRATRSSIGNGVNLSFRHPQDP